MPSTAERSSLALTVYLTHSPLRARINPDGISDFAHLQMHPCVKEEQLRLLLSSVHSGLRWVHSACHSVASPMALPTAPLPYKGDRSTWWTRPWSTLLPVCRPVCGQPSASCPLLLHSGPQWLQVLALDCCAAPGSRPPFWWDP